MQPFRVIGIDCAVDARKTGVASATLSSEGCRLDRVEVGRQWTEIDDWLVQEIESHANLLLAIDAPLGWPQALSQQLSNHRAGADLPGRPHALFRRQTDQAIKQRLNKQPLDVGADRIARTAKAALDLLTRLRQRTGQRLPLLWGEEGEAQRGAIEVYPAGTLLARGIPPTGYKGKGGMADRRRILTRLQPEIDSVNERLLLASDDALDAVICVLAGFDYLEGRCVAPSDTERETAGREGWIWVADKRI